MDIHIQLKKRHLYFFVSFVVLMGMLFFVTGQAPSGGPWHSATSIFVNYEGQTQDLQTVVDDLVGRIVTLENTVTGMTTGGGGTPSNPVQTVSGHIELSVVDTSGSFEACYFRVLINNAQVFPQAPSPNPCSGTSCQLSYNLNEITPIKCHNYIQWFLRDELNLSFVGNLLGENVTYFNIKNYDWSIVQGPSSSAGYNDATFTFEYVPQSAGVNALYSCPGPCSAFTELGGAVSCSPSSTNLLNFDHCCSSGTQAPNIALGCWPEFNPL